MPPHLRPVLLELEAGLRATFGPRLRDVRLFGSYARAEAHEESDVDVLVLVDRLDLAEVGPVADVATRVGLETGTPLAVLPMASERYAVLAARGRGLVTELERDGERA